MPASSRPYLQPMLIGLKNKNKDKMIRKIKVLAIVLMLLTLFTFGVKTLRAQNELSDYSFQYEQYTKDYKDFLQIKDEYLQYETLESQEKMIQSLKVLLIQRAEAERSYFLLLRNRLRNSPGLILSEKNKLINYLTEEVIFLGEHKKEIAGLDQAKLQDLLDLSEEFESKEIEYKNKSYQTLFYLLLGKTKDLQSDAVSINALFNEEINNQVLDRQDFLRSWLEEADSQVLLSQKKTDETELSAKQFEESLKVEELINAFNKIKSTMQDSKLALDKALSYQKELLGKL